MVNLLINQHGSLFDPTSTSGWHGFFCESPLLRGLRVDRLHRAWTPRSLRTTSTDVQMQVPDGARFARFARFSYWDGRNPTVDKWIISGISHYLEGFYLPRLPRSKISSIHSRLGLLGVLGGLYLPLGLNFWLRPCCFGETFCAKHLCAPHGPEPLG